MAKKIDRPHAQRPRITDAMVRRMRVVERSIRYGRITAAKNLLDGDVSDPAERKAVSEAIYALNRALNRISNTIHEATP